MTVVDTIILAGGKASPAMQQLTGTDVRALTPLGGAGQTMLDYVAMALRDSVSVGRIAAVGAVPKSETYTSLPPGATLMDNLFAGLDAMSPFAEGARVLVSTSDIPFLTPASVDDFITQALATGADFCYSILPIGVCQAAYPQMARTTVRVREGEFTGGNLMLLNPAFLHAHRQTLARAYAARKQPLRLGAMLGWGLLARLALAQMGMPSLLSVGQLEQAVSRLLGERSRARAIVSNYAEIGTDIDSPEDVAAARVLLSGAAD